MSYKSAWDDLKERLKTAVKRIDEINIGDYKKLHGKRLNGERQGIRLALSYMRDSEKVLAGRDD